MLNAGMCSSKKFKMLCKIGLGPSVEANGWFNHPKAIQLRTDLKAGKYQNIERVLTFQYENNSEMYSLLISALKQWPGNPLFLRKYLEVCPQSAHAFTVNGCNHIHWAWQARTGGRADGVSDKQWDLFYERLDSAGNLLHRAIELNKNNAEAYSYLIMQAMGLGEDSDDIFPLFTSLKIKQKQHVIGHTHMLYSLTDKWGGSHEAMFSFARNTFNNIEAGNPLAVLIAQAHIEMWSELDDEDEASALVYMSSKEVREELIAAYNYSINHKDYKPGALNPLYAGMFAMAFYLAAEHKLARINCNKLTQGFAEYPWYYLNLTHHEALNAGYVLDRVVKQLKSV